MNATLKKYVSQYGKESLKNYDQLKQFLFENNTNTKYIHQLILFIDSGNISDYIYSEEKTIKGVELNNIITGSVADTGLSIETVKKLTYDVLSSCDYSCEYETLFAVEESMFDFLFEKTKIEKPSETAFFGYDETKNMLESAISDYEIGLYIESLVVFSRLAKAGNATAMYYIGLAYLDGRGTEQNENEAIKWFRYAAKNGEPRAKAKIGDFYFNNENILKNDYKEAFKNYSSLGVLSAEPKAKVKIITILNQKKVNLITIIISGALLLFMWLFLFFVHSSIHHSVNLIGLGIPITLICTIIFVLSFLYFKATVYNSVKMFSFVMFIIWSIYPLVLAIN